MQNFSSLSSHFNRLAHRCHGILAIALLALMFGLGFSAMTHNSAIVDEVAHIPAAYSYLHYGDYRLNPEHPPLMKDLAALPLQFMQLNFPNGATDPWTTQINAQWDTGWKFLYHSGNDAGKILFWSRLPILLLAVAFGGVLYLYLRRRFGIAVALIGLFFYALSPNILASSIFVTTDLGASVFAFISLVTFVRYSESPNRGNLALLALALAVAQLAKFSSILLYPFLGLMTILLAFVWRTPATLKQRFKVFTGGFVLASVISIGLVWIAYIPHTIGMTTAVQQHLINHALPVGIGPAVAGVLDVLSPIPVFKPLVQFILGVSMVFARVAGGNTTYFLGQVTNQSFHGYFPVLFMVKTQLSLLIIGFGATILALARLLRRRPIGLKLRAAAYLRQHLTETTLGLFAAFYFAVSVAGNLNLGIRHILPIYIPLFVLAALAVVRVGRRLIRDRNRRLYAGAMIVLLAWYGGATLLIAPSYVAYFNELIGGPARADHYFSDSSVDWGQDLLRFGDYIRANHIDTVALDYFGGGQTAYYFPDSSKVIPWHSSNGRYPGQYIAVSETYLENDIYYSKLDHTANYQYLRDMQPIARIGYSIYLYKLY